MPAATDRQMMHALFSNRPVEIVQGHRRNAKLIDSGNLIAPPGIWKGQPDSPAQWKKPENEW